MDEWQIIFDDFASKTDGISVFNPKDKSHVYLFQNYLIEMNMPIDEVDSAIKMLLGEQPETDPRVRSQAKKLGLVSKGYGNWGKDKDGPTTHRNVDGKLVPVDDDEKDDKEDKEKEKPKAKANVVSKDAEADREKDHNTDVSTDYQRDGGETDFTSKSEPTDDLFTTKEEGYKKITTKTGKSFTVRQLKDENGEPIDTSAQEGREKAISIVRGRLEELKAKSEEAIDLLKKEKDPTQRILALKWLGEYGEMEAYADLLERGGVSDVYLLTDSEPKNDLVVIVEDEERQVDAYGVSVKTAEGGTMANKRGSSVKGDFMDRLEKSPNRNIQVDGVSEPVDAGVLLNAGLELRKRIIKKLSNGKVSQNLENKQTEVEIDGEKVSITEYFRRQKVTVQDIEDIFGDDKIFPNNKRNPIRTLNDDVLPEEQMSQLREHFQKKFIEYNKSGEMTIAELQDKLIDSFADVLEQAQVDLLPSADIMVSYYNQDGFQENGFITKEAQTKKMEDNLGPINELSKKDQITKLLGLDFTGRGAGKKKEGTGYVDGQSFGRPDPKLQPEATDVSDYVGEITK